MRAIFPAGRLAACPRFLDAVPRPAMVRAIVSHFSQPPGDGPIESRHEHEGRGFIIETAADRSVMAIRLE